MARFSVSAHPAIRRLEKRLQAIPTWLVALLAICLLSLSILWVQMESNPLSKNALLYQKKEIFRILLGDAESIAIVVAVILYVKGAPDRKAQKHYEAWRTIDTAAAAKVTMSYARYRALQDLHRDGVSLQWLEAPGANLSDIDLPYANLQACNLAGSNLQNANLRGANLEGANLAGANLSQADLVGSNLTSANLQAANLRGTALWEARLWEANFAEAELRWADVHQEQLSEAKLGNTILPDGSVGDAL